MSMVERYVPDALVASNQHPLTLQTVVVASGQGVLERGSLLMRNESGKFVLAGESVSYESVTPESGDNPAGEGWYEEDGEGYKPTEDTEPASGKAYYERTATSAGSAEVILAESANASAADSVAAAYNSGDFFEQSLIVSAGYAVTETDRLNLKNAGVYLVSGMRA